MLMILAMQFLYKISQTSPVVIVNSKVQMPIHILNIIPLNILWDAIFPHVVIHCHSAI